MAARVSRLAAPGQKLLLAPTPTYLLNINDVNQFNHFIPLGVGTFETKVTGEINDIQFKCSHNKTNNALKFAEGEFFISLVFVMVQVQ